LGGSTDPKVKPLAKQDTRHYTEILVMGQREALRGFWVVALCPSEALNTCRNILAGMQTTGASFSGRTMIYPEGGRLSLLGPGDDLDTKRPLKVLFVGWDRDSPHKTVLNKWRERATEILQRVH